MEVKYFDDTDSEVTKLEDTADFIPEYLRSFENLDVIRECGSTDKFMESHIELFQRYPKYGRKIMVAQSVFINKAWNRCEELHEHCQIHKIGCSTFTEFFTFVETQCNEITQDTRSLLNILNEKNASEKNVSEKLRILVISIRFKIRLLDKRANEVKELMGIMDKVESDMQQEEKSRVRVIGERMYQAAAMIWDKKVVLYIAGSLLYNLTLVNFDQAQAPIDYLIKIIAAICLTGATTRLSMTGVIETVVRSVNTGFMNLFYLMTGAFTSSFKGGKLEGIATLMGTLLLRVTMITSNHFVQSLALTICKFIVLMSNINFEDIKTILMNGVMDMYNYIGGNIETAYLIAKNAWDMLSANTVKIFGSFLVNITIKPLYTAIMGKLGSVGSYFAGSFGEQETISMQLAKIEDQTIKRELMGILTTVQDNLDPGALQVYAQDTVTNTMKEIKELSWNNVVDTGMSETYNTFTDASQQITDNTWSEMAYSAGVVGVFSLREKNMRPILTIMTIAMCLMFIFHFHSSDNFDTEGPFP